MNSSPFFWLGCLVSRWLYLAVAAVGMLWRFMSWCWRFSLLEFEFNLRAPGTLVRVAHDFPHHDDKRFGCPIAADATPIARTLVGRSSTNGPHSPPDHVPQVPAASPGVDQLEIARTGIGRLYACGSAFCSCSRPDCLSDRRCHQLLPRFGGAPTRSTTSSTLSAPIGWVAALIPVCLLVESRADIEGNVLRAINVVAAVMLPVTILIAPTTVHAAIELPAVIKSWRPALDARQRRIRELASQGHTDLVLAPIAFSPAMYFWSDLGPRSRQVAKSVYGELLWRSLRLRVPTR